MFMQTFFVFRCGDRCFYAENVNFFMHILMLEWEKGNDDEIELNMRRFL